MREIKNLKQIKKTEKKKRVLFVNPRRETCEVNIPNMGLAILGAILKKRGHEILIVDYQMIHSAPKISEFIGKFKPDLIGVSILTANTNEAKEIISEVKKVDEKIPVLAGGPHATLYPEDLEKNLEIDYIIKGEAETIIIDLIERGKKQKKPIVVCPKKIVNLDKIPYANYKNFYRWEDIRSYPVMTSRGCPYHCSFCPVAHVGQKKWRQRNSEDCIKEIEIAKKEISPHLHVLIQDDNPLVIKERFHKFLEMFARLNLRISVTNIRADDVSDRLLKLLKKAGCNSVGIGVESANQEVFKLVNKGEPFEAIDRAANLINKNKMNLSFCFVIGLPRDNLQRIKDSIKFAQKHKPDTIYWNMAMPYKNTAIRKWFAEHGRLFYDEIGKTSLSDGDFMCDEPSVETTDFTKWERKKAHYMCLFRTVDDRLKIGKIPAIFSKALKYEEVGSFFYWLPRGIVKSVKRKFELLRKFEDYMKREGFVPAIKRSLFLVREK